MKFWLLTSIRCASLVKSLRHGAECKAKAFAQAQSILPPMQLLLRCRMDKLQMICYTSAGDCGVNRMLRQYMPCS